MLRPGCPRCDTPVGEWAPDRERTWHCPDHGRGPVLWRPEETSYDDLVAHLDGTGDFPTLLPWPLGADWRVSDVARVGGVPDVRGTLTACSGTSQLDGPVDVLVLVEDPGTGLGERVAGIESLPPRSVGEGPPAARVRVEEVSVPLWAVSTSAADEEWDRTVLVGEAGGRWLWVVLRPASAVLLMRDEWILRDLAQAGPALVELPFGGPAPRW